MTAVLEAEFAMRYPQGPRIVAKLRIAADRFGVTVLFGPSGAGKTTVLRCLAGLHRPDSGSIRLGNHVWFDAVRRVCLPPQERDIGYLSQDYALFPHLTVAGNISYGLPKGARAANTQRCTELVQMLELSGLENRYPRQLSGGQQQRVALARAVARHPKLLLLDEPLSALDAPTREQLRPELRHWLAQMGVPTIMVTHHLTEAMTLGDTLVVMAEGKICQVGPVEEVVTHPASLAVARIVGVENLQPGTVVSTTARQVTVRVGDVYLQAETAASLDGNVIVGIRAEEVRLALSLETADRVENNLSGVVREVHRERNFLRVRLDCGLPLTALVPPHLGVKLGLREGLPIVAFFPAAAVHLIASDVS